MDEVAEIIRLQSFLRKRIYTNLKNFTLYMLLNVFVFVEIRSSGHKALFVDKTDQKYESVNKPKIAFTSVLFIWVTSNRLDCTHRKDNAISQKIN